MKPRVRRLQADYQRIQTTFADHEFVSLVEATGTPPDGYVFEFRVNGLVEAETGDPEPRSPHRAQIFLPADYPRRPPICRMTTPVFHPNIDPQKICIGDHWSAGQSLAELVVRLAEMICYQSYNTKSPLNAAAAAWAEKNVARLPLHRADLTAGL